MLQGYQVKQLIEQRYPELKDKIYPSFSTTVEDISIIMLNRLLNNKGGLDGKKK